MREIIRCYLVPHVSPTLGYSSFDAWQGMPEVENIPRQIVTDNPVVSGFLAQFGTVKVALEATINRAVKERHDLIVDGVHVLPTRLDLEPARDKAVLVPLVLAVTTIGRLDDQLQRRSREQPDRDSKRQRDALNGIWELQTFMVDQAERGGVPVVANWSLDETVGEIMDEVMRQIGIRFPPDPATLEKG
jgi:2-phosphoglycerate kinase